MVDFCGKCRQRQQKIIKGSEILLFRNPVNPWKYHVENSWARRTCRLVRLQSTKIQNRSPGIKEKGGRHFPIVFQNPPKNQWLDSLQMEGWMNQCFLQGCIGPQNNQVRASQYLLFLEMFAPPFLKAARPSLRKCLEGSTHKTGFALLDLPSTQDTKPRDHQDDITFLSSGNPYKHHFLTVAVWWVDPTHLRYKFHSYVLAKLGTNENTPQSVWHDVETFEFPNNIPTVGCLLK